MILYPQDFQEQNAIIDTRTNNIAFIRFVELLKRMNVQNRYWCLTLMQSELQGVDPFNANLSEDMKVRVAIECKINPWYFVRECVRVPQAGVENAPYIPNRANMAHLWCFLNELDTFLTIPRQRGKTVSIITIMAWLIYFAGHSTNIGLFAKDGALQLENVDRLKVIRDGVPKYLIYKSTDDTDNKEGVVYAALKNKYLTYIAQRDKRAAEGQARGQTFIVEHWDEMAFYVNNDISYPVAISASKTGAEQAKKIGIPAANIISTTAGDLSDPSGRYAYSMRMNSVKFREHLYDVGSREKLYDIVNTNSSNRMVYLEFSYKQLGKDDAWLADVTRGLPKATIDKDYRNIWYSGSSHGVIPEHLTNKLQANIREPDTSQLFNTLILNWYVDPLALETGSINEKVVILGCDTSDNIGKDFTTLVMTDPEDLSTMMTCRCNVSNLVIVAECVVKLLIMWPNLIWIPERNKNGTVLIDMVISMFEGNPNKLFDRIYNTYYQDRDIEQVDVRELNLSDGRVRRAFGYTTTATSRDALYKDVLLLALETAFNRIYDSNIIDEATSLVIRNGRIDHAEGCNDDTLIGWVLACWFVLRGRNLSAYGIDPSKFLNSVSSEGEKIDPSIRQRHLNYAKEINRITKELDNSHLHDTTRIQLGHQLKHLNSIYKPELTGKNLIAMQQIEDKKIEDIKETRPPLLSFNTPSSLLSKLF